MADDYEGLVESSSSQRRNPQQSEEEPEEEILTEPDESEVIDDTPPGDDSTAYTFQQGRLVPHKRYKEVDTSEIWENLEVPTLRSGPFDGGSWGKPLLNPNEAPDQKMWKIKTLLFYFSQISALNLFWSNRK